jgi:uncharacterized protein
MSAPVWVGSGVTPTTVKALFEHADGLIGGTAFRSEGITTNPVEPSRVREFMKAVREAR